MNGGSHANTLPSYNVRACARARACVRACTRACVRTCVPVCLSVSVSLCVCLRTTKEVTQPLPHFYVQVGRAVIRKCPYICYPVRGKGACETKYPSYLPKHERGKAIRLKRPSFRCLARSTKHTREATVGEPARTELVQVLLHLVLGHNNGQIY